MQLKTRFDVSARMQVYLGAGDVPDEPSTARDLRIGFSLGGSDPATLSIGARDLKACDLAFLVDRDGCRDILGDVPDEHGTWFLGTAQRAIALAVLDCALPEPARQTMRIVKAIELLCLVTTELRQGALVSAVGAGELSELDARRIIAARRIVDERWHEKLTIDGIARACGLNRAKLTKGFRELFACSVGDALAENRLDGARRLLLASDLPVSAIGYRCGYHNNASFARAFARRFGVAPSQLRACGIAA